MNYEENRGIRYSRMNIDFFDSKYDCKSSVAVEEEIRRLNKEGIKYAVISEDVYDAVNCEEKEGLLYGYNAEKKQLEFIKTVKEIKQLDLDKDVMDKYKMFTIGGDEMRHYISEKQAAEYLGVNRSTIWRWNRLGLVSHKIGGRRLYLKEEIDEFVGSGQKVMECEYDMTLGVKYVDIAHGKNLSKDSMMETQVLMSEQMSLELLSPGKSDWCILVSILKFSLVMKFKLDLALVLH